VKVCVACGSDRCDDAWTCQQCGSNPPSLEGFLAFAPGMASDNEGFREDYFGELAALEADNFWFRARNDLIIWAMKTYFAECRSFLEVGCGTGFVLSGIRTAFPLADLSGSEIFSAGLGFAAQRVPSARFYQVDARNLPFRDEFDVIGAFDVLEHIDEDEAVIGEVYRALRPSGGFLLSVPQHPALWSPQDDHAYHVRRYTRAGLRRKVEAAGFEIVRATSFVSFLLPMLVASRLRMRSHKPDPAFDAINELRQPRAINIVLERVMQLERVVIRHGVSFPAGGSLLLAARKPPPSGGLG
jgi:SAM-dependent methyltransferase